MDKPRPYVTAALFCEKVLQEKDEVLTAIRIIDKIQYRLEGPMPEGMKPAVNVQSLIALKSGPVTGDHVVSLVLHKPNGERKEVFAAPIKFLGGDKGQNLIAGITIGVQEDGVYWMDVLFEGEVLSRVPLVVTPHETLASQVQT